MSSLSKVKFLREISRASRDHSRHHAGTEATRSAKHGVHAGDAVNESASAPKHCVNAGDSRPRSIQRRRCRLAPAVAVVSIRQTWTAGGVRPLEFRQKEQLSGTGSGFLLGHAFCSSARQDAENEADSEKSSRRDSTGASGAPQAGAFAAAFRVPAADWRTSRYRGRRSAQGSTPELSAALCLTLSASGHNRFRS